MRRLFLAGLLAGLSACSAAPPPDSPRFGVFFESWSAAIGPDAQHTIQQAAEAARQTGAGPVLVSGHADPTGSAAANLYLTETRAQVVADALVQQGVSPSRIKQTAHGETGPVPDLQASRRVDIIVGR